jgi:hypothetical protein
VQNYQNVDIIDRLKIICCESTEIYRDDFKFDMLRIFSEAEKAIEDGEPRHLLWMARKNGTLCLPEGNVYIEGTPEMKLWCGFQNEPKGISTFAIVVMGVRDNTVIGNIYELDYAEHVKQVLKYQFKPCSMDIKLLSGEKINVAIDEFNFYRLQLELESIEQISYVIEDDKQKYLDFLKDTRRLRRKTFLSYLHSNIELDCDLIIGDTDMPASFVWGEDSRITEYGIEKFRPIMEADYEVLENGNIEIFCDDYELGEEFCYSAAGYISNEEYIRIFG